MRQGTLRLRSVKYKDGRGELRVIPDYRAKDREHAIKRVNDVMARQKDIAGYAIVVWGADGSCTSQSQSGPRSALPGIYVPDFVRNALLACKTVEWVEEELIGPQKP